MKITLSTYQNEYLQYPLTPAVVLVVWAAVAHVEAAVVAVARLAAEVEDDVGVGGVQLHLHTWCSDTRHVTRALPSLTSQSVSLPSQHLRAARQLPCLAQAVLDTRGNLQYL